MKARAIMFSARLRNRLLLTAVVLFATSLMLGWEHLNGGIQSHHFLGNPSYPPMNNAWAVLILPALTWFVAGRVETRGYDRVVVFGFVGALIYGAALSAAFASGHANVTAALFFAAFGLSAILPVYRAECILGFVLGMVIVLGPFIPTFFAPVFASVSALSLLLMWPALKRLWQVIGSASLPSGNPKQAKGDQ